MKLLRPAFVLTVAITGCSEPKTPETPKRPPGAHPQDADGHMIFLRGPGDCYVQVPKDEPPPPDLMSGERWVEDKSVTCPKEFDDPAFALPDGMYWMQDKETGKCSQGHMAGNPPPPPVDVPCPPSLDKSK